MAAINGLSPLALGRAKAAAGLATDPARADGAEMANNRDWFSFRGWNGLTSSITGSVSPVANRELAAQSVLTHLISS